MSYIDSSLDKLQNQFDSLTGSSKQVSWETYLVVHCSNWGNSDDDRMTPSVRVSSMMELTYCYQAKLEEE